MDEMGEYGPRCILTGKGFSALKGRKFALGPFEKRVLQAVKLSVDRSSLQEESPVVELSEINEAMGGDVSISVKSLEATGYIKEI